MSKKANETQHTGISWFVFRSISERYFRNVNKNTCSEGATEIKTWHDESHLDYLVEQLII